MNDKATEEHEVATVTRRGHPLYALTVNRRDLTRWGLTAEDVTEQPHPTDQAAP